MAEDTERTRRRVLRALAGTSLAGGLAGCNALESDTSATNTATTSRGDTPTATPDQPPTIETATVTTRENGQALAYRITARDDISLQSVVVSYGSHQWSPDTIDGNTVDHRGEFTDLSEASADGQVVYEVRDAAGQEARSSVDPDGQAPVLSTFHVEPTRNAGEIALTIEGEDDVGLEQVALLLDGTPQLQRDVSGQREATADTTVDVSDAATVGEINTLAGALEDWNGNRTESDSDTYVRKFDVMENPRLNVGTVYIPFAGDKFGKCFTEETDPEPTVGKYDGPIPPEVTSRHIDQMQGHGIRTAMFNFGENNQDYARFRNFAESGLIDEIDLEAYYVIAQAERRGRNIEADFEFMRENFLNRENYGVLDGRPVVTFWGATYMAWGGTDRSQQVKDRIMEEYDDGFEGYVDHIRSELTVDGTEPFLVADIHDDAMNFEYLSDYRDLAKQFDGLTNVTGKTPHNETVEWEEAFNHFERNYQAITEFANDHDQEFIPTVIPGFNDIGNTCWGSDRHVPRSSQHLQQLLELADEYRTTEKVTVFTWNDWTEGTHIEPGRFRGNTSGTDYVDVVAEFQQSS